MHSRAEVKKNAKAVLHANWGMAVVTLLLYSVVVSVITGITFGIGSFFLIPVLCIGLAWFYSQMILGAKPGVGEYFNESFQNYGRRLGGYLWMELFLFLWTLLFYIPGFIKTFAYSMTPYILANEKNVKAKAALKLSMRMTKGHKGEIFVYYLSFLGWAILSALTGGILYILYVGPYMQLTMAGLYQELRAEALRTGVIYQAELDGAQEVQ